MTHTRKKKTKIIVTNPGWPPTHSEKWVDMSNMREIKFRAWDKNRKEMLEWKSLIVLKTHLWADTPNHIILMQYTGLKDKNGKHEIYEGDLLRTPPGDFEPRETWEVEWSNGSYWLVQKKNGKPVIDISQPFILDQEQASKYEVVGNIWENPVSLFNL